MDNLEKIIEQIALDKTQNEKVISLANKLAKHLNPKSEDYMETLEKLCYWLYIYDQKDNVASLCKTVDAMSFVREYGILTRVASITMLYMRILREQNKIEEIEVYIPRIMQYYDHRDRLLRNIRKGCRLHGEYRIIDREYHNDEEVANEFRFREVIELCRVRELGGSEAYPVEKVDKEIDRLKTILAGNVTETKDLKEFEDWYKAIQDDEYEQRRFVVEIKKSPYTEYHYSLMTDKNTSGVFRAKLWMHFNGHREEGVDLLLSKLENNEDADIHDNFFFCLFAQEEVARERMLEFARKAINADNYNLRKNAIIILGWIGEIQDISLVGERLLNDTNETCRTQAAKFFMNKQSQSSIDKFIRAVEEFDDSIKLTRRSIQPVIDKSLPFLKQAISQETDYFILGCMIAAVKKMTGKKFDLPQYAINNIDTERIDKAKLKVERFFKKLYNE